MVEKALNDEAALQIVKSRYDLSSNYRFTNYDSSWDAYHKQYRSVISDEKNMPYMAQLFIPYSFTAVETVIPRIAEAVFSSDPIVAVKPVAPDDISNAKINEVLLNWQLRKMNLFETLIILSKMCLVYGTCVAKVDWKKDIRHKFRVNPLMDVYGYPVYNEQGKVQTQKEEYDVVMYDDPYIYPIDLYRFYIQPGATSIEDAEYCIAVTETTIGELKQLETAGIYKNISKLEEVKGTLKFDKGKNRYTNVNLTDPNTTVDNYSEKVTLYEYWENNRVIVVAEDKVVIRNEENPYWHCRKPFVAAKICPVENEFYGIGLMEMVKSLQAELNDVRNQRLDNVKLALNKMYVVARDADVDIKKLISEPGGIISSNYVDGVKWIEASDITASAYSEAKIITDDIQNVHGIYDYSKGATPNQRETATGILSLQEAANVRFKLMIMVMLKNLLNPSVEIMNDLNQQFITSEKVLMLTGQEFVRIENIDEIAGRYDYEPIGASLEGLSKYARTQQIINARQVLASNPNLNLTRFDMDILDLMNFKNPAEYFNQPQPIIPGQPGAEQQMTPGQPGVSGQIPGQETGQPPIEQSGQTDGQIPPELQALVQNMGASAEGAPQDMSSATPTDLPPEMLSQGRAMSPEVMKQIQQAIDEQAKVKANFNPTEVLQGGGQ